jgi:large subunit ribosomal protein L31
MNQRLQLATANRLTKARSKSIMKIDLHPTDYRPVVFQDTSSGFSFLTKSTAATQEEIKWEDGKTYPLVKVHISSASHPFFTGEEKIVDVEGRVDKFKARAEAAKKALDAKKAAAEKASTKKAKAQEKTEKPAKEPKAKEETSEAEEE